MWLYLILELLPLFARGRLHRSEYLKRYCHAPNQPAQLQWNRRASRPGRHFQRHRSRHPARCQRISVSGRTMTSASRQSNSLERKTRLIRVAASMRRGLMPLSLCSASCRRRKRFSASSERFRLPDSRSNQRRSVNSRKRIWATAITS